MNSPDNRKPNIQITDRDYKVLRFIWRWKCATTMTIAKKFFVQINPHSAYRRLQFLEAAGFIQSKIVSGRFFEVWTLKEKGFKYILPKLGYLESNSFKSDYIEHDFLVTALHLGEWLTHQPDNTQTYTERQLTCFPAEHWPAWIPKSKLHRPDGFSIQVRVSTQFIAAFEVELSIKTSQRYESVATYYDGETTISSVIWLVLSRNDMNRLQDIFKKLHVRDLSKHNFILHHDFLKFGWSAQVQDGNFKGQSLLNIFNRNGVVQASKWHRDLDASALLDSRKRPINSKSYESTK